MKWFTGMPTKPGYYWVTLEPGNAVGLLRFDGTHWRKFQTSVLSWAHVGDGRKVPLPDEVMFNAYREGANR